MSQTTTATPLKGLAGRVQPAPSEVAIDAIDRQLLIELTRDARVPQRRLAEDLGMSSPAVADRIARLREKGVIQGFSVNINWEKLGYSTVAYLSIENAAGQDQGKVLDALLRIRGIQEISVVTGAADMLVKIRTRGWDDFRQILTSEIWSIDGVQQTETSIVIVREEPNDVAEKMLHAVPTAGEK